jgi:hypothetical protein
MNNNTILYVGLGVVAVYLLTSKKTATSLPIATLPAGSVAPGAPASSSSLILSAASGLASIFNQVKSSQQAATNVAQGYNADGTINTGNTTQDSINTLDPGTPGLSLNIPSGGSNLLNNAGDLTYVDPNTSDELDSYFDA